jgi:hypothetical protein
MEVAAAESTRRAAATVRLNHLTKWLAISAGVVALVLVGSGWWCFTLGRESRFSSAWVIRSQQCEKAAIERAQAGSTGDTESKEKRRR